MREAQHDSQDLYISTFIDCLLASADYDSFYKVMAREGSRVASAKAAARQPSLRSDDKLVDEKFSDAKAAKGVEADADGKLEHDVEGDAAEKKAHK